MILSEEGRKAKSKEYQEEYYSRPERKAQIKEYEARPEVKARRSRYSKISRNSSRDEVYSVYSKLHSDSDIPCCRCCGLKFMLVVCHYRCHFQYRVDLQMHP